MFPSSVAKFLWEVKWQSKVCTMSMEPEPKGPGGLSGMSASLGSRMSAPAPQRQCWRAEGLAPPLGRQGCLSCWPSAGSWAWIASLVKIEHKPSEVWADESLGRRDCACSYQLVFQNSTSPSSFLSDSGCSSLSSPQGPAVPCKKLAKAKHQTSFCYWDGPEEWMDILLKWGES